MEKFKTFMYYVAAAAVAVVLVNLVVNPIINQVQTSLPSVAGASTTTPAK